MDRVFCRDDQFTIQDLEEGGCFLVDKPIGWTSFDVVNKLRFAIRAKLGKKKYKIGHAGTLDPLAEGLLLICFSKYTKKIENLVVKNKTYTGTIQFWGQTRSYDREWPIDTYFPTVYFDTPQLEKVRDQFLGVIEQTPPMFSALKKNGIPLYKLARKGIKTEIKSRNVEISIFDIKQINLPFLDFEICCSKGTYIRSLAYDFGLKLGNGAFLAALRRNKIGEYDVKDAWSVDELFKTIQSL